MDFMENHTEKYLLMDWTLLVGRNLWIWVFKEVFCVIKYYVGSHGMIPNGQWQQNAPSRIEKEKGRKIK